MEIAGKKQESIFFIRYLASRIRDTRRLNPELGVAVWRRVDVSLYACRKRCPGAEARETRGWHGRRVERITNMTSILRQTGGEAITVGGVRPPPSPTPSPPPRLVPVPAILALHTRTLNFDFVGIKASNVSQVGGRPCFVYVLCGTNWCPLTRRFVYTPILIHHRR